MKHRMGPAVEMHLAKFFVARKFTDYSSDAGAVSDIGRAYAILCDKFAVYQ